MYVDVVQISLLPSAVDLTRQNVSVLVYLLWACMYMRACTIHRSVCILSVYVGYMVLASYTDPMYIIL